jgi:hypothetical protein
MSDDETERVRRQVKLHGEDSLNRLDRWRWNNIRAADKLAAERRAEERAQQQQDKQTTVDQLRAEMAALRTEMYKLHEVMIEATGEAVGQHGDKLLDHAEKFVKDVQRDMEREFFTLTEKQFARLEARLDMLPKAQARTSKDFKFASENESANAEVIDLPNPLGIVRKVTVN